MSKQRTKKATTGDKVAGDIWGTDFNGGVNFSKGAKIDAAARRIDRAVSAAVRKERERCIQCVRTCVSPGALETSIISEINRP